MQYMLLEQVRVCSCPCGEAYRPLSRTQFCRKSDLLVSWLLVFDTSSPWQPYLRVLRGGPRDSRHLEEDKGVATWLRQAPPGEVGKRLLAPPCLDLLGACAVLGLRVAQPIGKVLCLKQADRKEGLSRRPTLAET